MRKPKIIGRFTLILALGFMNGMLPPGLAIAQTATPSWTLTGNLNTARYGHTATLLPNGKVLVAGGVGPNSCSSLSTAELYDPVSGTWSATGSLLTKNGGLYFNTAMLLQSGQVLVVGSYFENDYANTVELYDPATGTWRLTGALNTIRTLRLATLLTDGKVLAVGQTHSPQLPISAEVYDPSTESWSGTGAPLLGGLGGHMVTLPTGKVLFLSEVSPWDYGVVGTELYDPATGQWSDAGFLDMFWTTTVTLLRNGKVLVTGQSDFNNPLQAQLYDPSAGRWSSTGNLNTFRHYGGFTATLLADGRVLVAGGVNYPGEAVSAEELYDPTTGTWSLTSRLLRRRDSHTATLLGNGKVLVAGGRDDLWVSCDTSLHGSTELYGPGTNAIDDVEFFVRQHYLDFLNREPDPAGFAGWMAVLDTCTLGDTSCDRIHVSSAFFRSPEFQGRGYFVYRFYPVAFGRKPDYDEFTPDLAKVSGFLTDAELEAAKLAFIAEFMNRPAFLSKFNGLSNMEFVDTLLSSADITHPSRDSWIAALTNGSRTRSQVLREIAESTEVDKKYYNQAFVVMQYFGYLRRQPDALYLNWIAHLDATGDYRSMINGFISSAEYRARFGP